MEICIACGMPMNGASDYAMNDPMNDYCRYCARPDGSMQSFEEKLESMTAYIIKTEGIDASEARDLALNAMADLPAWRQRILGGE